MNFVGYVPCAKASEIFNQQKFRGILVFEMFGITDVDQIFHLMKKPLPKDSKIVP